MCVLKECCDASVESALHEVRALMRLRRCPHVVKLRGFFEENIAGSMYLYIDLEYCAGGDLAKLIKGRAADKERGMFAERELAGVLWQLCAGVRWVHACRIIHCDIKPANVLLTAAGRVKLCDFGICKLLKHTGASTHRMAGSRAFMAPEVLRYFVGEKVSFTSSADIWSLGVVAVAMATLQSTPRMPRLAEGGVALRELLVAVRRGVRDVEAPAAPPLPKDAPGGRATVREGARVAEGAACTEAHWACDFVRQALVMEPGARASVLELLPLFPRRLAPPGGVAAPPPAAASGAGDNQRLAREADGHLREACPSASKLWLCDLEDGECDGGRAVASDASASAAVAAKVKRGWVTVRGQYNPHWQRRWLCLTAEGELHYFAAQDAEAPRGTIDCGAITAIEAEGEGVETWDHRLRFRLDTPKRTWHLKAEDERARDAWTRSIAQARHDVMTKRVLAGGFGAGGSGVGRTSTSTLFV